MAPESPVVDHLPPRAVLRVVNPVLRTLLTSPAGRIVPLPLVVLRFRGRRTGRTYRIVVVWHDAEDGKVVFSLEQWALNFRGGAPVAVAHAGRWRQGTATLVEDPERVARALQGVLEAGTSARTIGLEMPAGHRITAADIRAVRRKMIYLELDAPGVA